MRWMVGERCGSPQCRILRRFALRGPEVDLGSVHAMAFSSGMRFGVVSSLRKPESTDTKGTGPQHEC